MKAEIRRLGFRWWMLRIPKDSPVSPFFHGRNYYATFAEAVDGLDQALRTIQRSAG